MIVDINNFFKASVGTFTHIKEVPKEFTLFFKSDNSEYYTNKDETEVVRVSDHWGSGIRECNWYLSGFERNNSFFFNPNSTALYIGQIKFLDLTDIQNK